MNTVTWLVAQITANQLNVPKGEVTPSTFENGLQVVFGFAGVAALLVIIWGGFKYVTSQGNPQQTAQAKNTIIYALIGLIICLLAFSIVTFAVNLV